MTTMTDFTFDADTAIEPAGEHVHSAELTDRWTALGGTPNGGYMLGVCLRALQADMPHPDPLVTSAHFLRPGAVGPAEVRTEVVRSGRRVATGEARLLQDGREIVRLLATFGDLSESNGRTLLLSRPPEVPGWARGQPGGDPSLEFWMRFKDGRDADPLALAALVDAAAPAVLDIGAAGSATIELTVHVRARPAPGWLACRATTRHVIGGYHEEDFEIWDSAGSLVAQSRQFALLPE